jgi:hypothetical protein
MSELFAEGDLVEAVKNEFSSSTMVRGVLKSTGWENGFILQAQGFSPEISYLESRGFTLTLIEKATPPLPTEPGIYVSWVNPPSPKIVHKLLTGFWVDAGDNNYLEDSDVSAIMPMTRLEPVDVTAKKVLERVREMYDGSQRTTPDVIKLVAKEFGVTS